MVHTKTHTLSLRRHVWTLELSVGALRCVTSHSSLQKCRVALVWCKVSLVTEWGTFLTRAGPVRDSCQSLCSLLVWPTARPPRGNSCGWVFCACSCLFLFVCVCVCVCLWNPHYTAIISHSLNHGVCQLNGNIVFYYDAQDIKCKYGFLECKYI